MKKLFISQPMRGKTDKEILAVREKAIKSAEKQVGEPVEVIDSFFQVNHLNFFHRLMWRFSLKDGTKPEDARLRILVLLNMELRLLLKIKKRS